MTPPDAPAASRNGPTRAEMARRRVWSVLGRVGFAATLWVLVAVAGIASGTWARALPPAILDRWGFAPVQLWQGGWWKLAASTVLAHGPAMYWMLLLVFVPLSAGALEWLAGTRRALLVFWASDLGGSLLVALGVVLPLDLDCTGRPRAGPQRDVGMSGGGFGCLGALVSRLPTPWRGRSIALAGVYLLARIATFADPWADTLHLVAFFAGLALDRILGRGSIDGGRVHRTRYPTRPRRNSGDTNEGPLAICAYGSRDRNRREIDATVIRSPSERRPGELRAVA